MLHFHRTRAQFPETTSVGGSQSPVPPDSRYLIHSSGLQKTPVRKHIYTHIDTHKDVIKKQIFKKYTNKHLLIIKHKAIDLGAGEMAEGLTVLTALLEAQLVPNVYMLVYNYP